MTPRPIHRWKSLWLGILIASFLGWAWWDSLHFESSVAWHRFAASNVSGAIFFGSDSHGAASPEPVRTRTDLKTFAHITISAFVPPAFLRGGGEGVGEAWAAAVSSESPAVYHEVAIEGMRFQPRGDWMIILPYWLVMLAFVIPWSGFLVWRQRTIKRLASTPA